MPDCIIVGGGVIGLMTARQLHLQGVDVLLLEKGSLGGESSWAGGGIISPLYPWRYAESVNILAERSKTIYPEIVSSLHEESGQDSELLTSGLFTVTDNSPQITDWVDRWNINASYTEDINEIQEIEPVVGDAVSRGLWMPDVMQVRNPRFVKALKASFEKLSIPYQENTEVEEIVISDNKVSGVKTAGKLIASDRVIIASGAWSAQFTSTANVDVLPVKGQMIMYRGEPGLVKRMVLSEGHYVIPRKDGHILAGSTLERIGFDKTISESAMDELHQSAIDLVPLLNELTIERQWAGLRPGTEKGIPYVCRHNEVEGLYIHAGHFRNGIVLGAASAELMADIVLEKPVEWCNPSAYSMNAVH